MSRRSLWFDVVSPSLALAALIYTLAVWAITGHLDQLIAGSSVITLAVLILSRLVYAVRALRAAQRHEGES